jgi:hypothetical protein
MAFTLALSLCHSAAEQQPKPQEPPAYELYASDITAVPGQCAPLAISRKSPAPVERTFVGITDVPEGTCFSSGVNIGGKHWVFPTMRLNGLTLALPKGTAETLGLEVQLLDSDARIPLSAKSKFEVRIIPPSQTESAVSAVSPAECQVIPC